MTGDRSRLRNFVKKFIGIVRFENDYFCAIMGYEDYVICDNLKVAFRKHSCYVRDVNGVDLITGNHGTNLYTISVEDMMKSSPICLLSKASKNKSWLWHRWLNHLNFVTINDLARKDLQIQVGLIKTVKYIRTDNGTEFVNQFLTEYYESVGIFHQKSVLRTPQQNGVVERRNRTLVEAARTVLILSKALMFLWAEVVATACYTQNRSIIYTRHNKTPYELVHDKQPDLKFLYVFGAICYPTNDSEDLGKLRPTVDIRMFVDYAPNRKGYRIYNKRTRRIMEAIHVQFDEVTEPMAHVHISTGPEPILLTPGQISLGLVPDPVPAAPYVPPTNKDLKILFQLMFDEYFEPPGVERTVPPAFAVQVPYNLLSHIKVLQPTIEDNPFAQPDNDLFVNVFAPKPSSDESSSREVSSAESTQVVHPHNHLGKWSKDHPLDNVIGNPSRPVSTKKQLATDALWCL
ncbi:integrase, catalytic region, zinc finger, CCHC-type containing protein [Tanacetum coccineum]